MKVVLALRAMTDPGGLQTFVLTVADHLPALGHEVTIFTAAAGMAAEFARERGLRVVTTPAELPPEADATIAFDRVMAIDMAAQYPRARRLFGMHNTDEFWLPPTEPGIVAATLAPNDRLALLARGCAGAGEVIRIRQPIDLYRFLPRGLSRSRPAHVLLLGNYASLAYVGSDHLRAAWSRHELEWHRCGHPEPTMAVASEIAKADIVVGYGRSILEAMACARPAYVHEHSGSDGWVTADTYSRLEADGFAGTAIRLSPTADELREDFKRYTPALGGVGHDLIRANHDARFVTAELMGTIAGFDPPSHSYDKEALSSIKTLSLLLYRSNGIIRALREEMRVNRLRYESEAAELKEHIGRNELVQAQQKALLLKQAQKRGGRSRKKDVRKV